MKDLIRQLWVGLAMIAMPVALVEAAEPGSEEDAESTESDWERRVEQAHIERAKTLMKQSLARAPKPTDERRTLKVRIEGYDDQTVCISEPYPPELEPVLVRMGYRKVSSPPSFDAGVLHRGRRYGLLPVSSSSDFGVAASRAKRLIGQQAEVVVAKLTNGLFQVVEVREIQSEDE
jgi:hypothetical protein